ncbi:MAG: hypothetical protein WC831_01065 [Parcubacteria group bacterium]
MSHKTIYIDIDEEITSIIDRIRKAEAGEVIIVAPKRALLLQSLVNLKLLKKESDRRKRRIMIVTQDKIGKKLIEKAGILVQGEIEGPVMEDEEISENSFQKNMTISEGEREEILRENDEQESFGSGNYFEDPPRINQNQGQGEKFSEGGEAKDSNIENIEFSDRSEKIMADLNNEKEGGKKSEKSETHKKTDKSVRMSDIVASPKPKPRPKSKAKSRDVAAAEKKGFQEDEKKSEAMEQFYQKTNNDAHIENQAEKFFGGSPTLQKQEKVSKRKAGKLKETKIKSKVGLYFMLFAVVFLLMAGVAWAYFNLPKAQVVLHLKGQEKTSSADIVASTSQAGINWSENKIPAAVEEITQEKSRDFNATGSKNGGGKATGKVVIYNEFSSDDQPLVSTTRLETADGKIFRIKKSVIVPGMTKVGSETKPGAIEVDVAADKAGKDFNIEPADFKIPGFEGGPKYDKFYAKSSKAMSGGSEGETLIVSAQDIEKAKEQLVAEAEKKAIEGISRNLPSGKKIFEDSVVTETVSAAPSESAGTEAEKFTYAVKVKAQTLSFSDDDVRQVVEAEISKQGQLVNFNNSITYVLSEEKLKEGEIKFGAKADFGVASAVDIENFKRGILGKKASEINSLAETYPAILKADISFWPFFVSRVPMSEKRVEITIK